MEQKLEALKQAMNQDNADIIALQQEYKKLQDQLNQWKKDDQAWEEQQAKWKKLQEEWKKEDQNWDNTLKRINQPEKNNLPLYIGLGLLGIFLLKRKG